jgi:hypothetical protein
LFPTSFSAPPPSRRCLNHAGHGFINFRSHASRYGEEQHLFRVLVPGGKTETLESSGGSTVHRLAEGYANAALGVAGVRGEGSYSHPRLSRIDHGFAQGSAGTSGRIKDAVIFISASKNCSFRCKLISMIISLTD